MALLKSKVGINYILIYGPAYGNYVFLLTIPSPKTKYCFKKLKASQLSFFPESTYYNISFISSWSFASFILAFWLKNAIVFDSHSSLTNNLLRVTSLCFIEYFQVTSTTWEYKRNQLSLMNRILSKKKFWYLMKEI